MPVAHPPTVCAGAFGPRFPSAPFVRSGASFTAVTLITNVCGALVSTPPPAVPPLSWTESVTVAQPLGLAAGVHVSVPVGDTAGPAENKPGFVLPVTLNWTV